MERQTRAESDREQTAKDENEELLARDKRDAKLEDTSVPNQDDRLAPEEPAQPKDSNAKEEAKGTPMAIKREGVEAIPVAVMEKRLPVETGEPSTTKQGIPEPTLPPSAEERFHTASSEMFEVISIPSRLYSEDQIEISSTSSSSQRSRLLLDVEDFADSGVTGATVSDSAVQPLALQFSDLSIPGENGAEESFAEREVEGSEGAGEAEQLVVMDPDHPLMERFQAALKAYLTKQTGNLTEELQELTVAKKHGKIQREEVGVILYGVQQQLARLQMEMEKNHNRHTQIAMSHRQLQEELQDLKNTYKKSCHGTEYERKTVAAMQAEMEDLSLRLFYVRNMDQDVRDDIAVMKRTVKKAEVERIRAEVEKKNQDLRVDRLTKRVNELQEQIALYEAQHLAQAEDTRVTRKEVGEACTEIQAITVEKKHLLHQWNVSLTGMKRRDEAYAAMQEALRDSRHKFKSLEIEIEIYKKSIIKEEERNELLSSILNRSDNDNNTTRKLIAQSSDKQEAMKADFGTYTRTLQETEQTLSRANVDHIAQTNEAVAIRREIEKGSEAKKDFENQIMLKLQEQMMSNKAAKYFLQLAAKLQRTIMDLDMQLTKQENDTAQTALDISNTKCNLKMLDRCLAEVDKELDGMNNEINHCEAEIAKRNLLIERKQGVINLYNKKLEMMISQLGGQELGPLELEIKKLGKLIDEIELDIVKIQRYWLKRQKELVKLMEEREKQLVSMDTLKREITVKEQKKVRTENEIQQEKNEVKDIERHMKNIGNDLVKLHLLINKNSANSEELQQGNSIMENEFVRSLKASERESIQLQEKLERLRDEKERLLNSLVEAECQMLQWEKKIQLAKEMRAAVDSETGQGEIRAMRTEIHRMQVRYNQLMKQQEKMMRDMEASVAHREAIVIRGEGQAKLYKQMLTKGEFQYKKQELMKRIKEAQRNCEDCNELIIQLEETQTDLSNELLEKQKRISMVNVEIDESKTQMDELQSKKRLNLSEIVSNQGRMKHMQAVKEGNYTPLCRTELMVRIERQKLEDRLNAINIIIHQLQQEHPEHQKTLQRLAQTLHAKLGTQAVL